MILPTTALRVRIASLPLVSLLVMAPGELPAIQISPNPNPDINTITITPAAPRENLVPFGNFGTINIEPLASFHNANRLDNSGVINNGGIITNSGTFTEVVRPFPNPGGGFLGLGEGSQFINQATGVYNGGDRTTGIAGTIINEGAVTHGLGHITVGETGQYIQRQAVGSSMMPTTTTPDGPFNNAGRVQIAAGDFSIDPISSRAAVSRYDQSSTGTTQIDARFQNIGGEVRNAGTMTVGSTGEYRQQGRFGPVYTVHTGLTVNTGVFLNGGTTSITTGVFENHRGFSSTGTVRVGAGASFSNVDSGYYVQSFYFQPFGATTKIEGSFTNIGEVQNGGAITVSSTGVYSQVAGVSSPSATNNPGTFTNAGQVRIGEGTAFSNAVVAIHPFPSGYYVQQTSGTTLIDGIFANSSRVENSGTVGIGTTGQYRQESSPRLLDPPSTVNSGTFTNAGQVRIGEGTSFGNFPRLENGSPAAVGGQYIQQAGGTTQIDGSFSNGGGRVTNEGAITVGVAGTYSQTRSAAPVPATPATVNSSTFTNAGSTLINAGTFTNHGSVVNSGTFQVGVNGVAILTNHGTMVNAGTFEVGPVGQVSGTGTYSQTAAAAQTIINGTFAHNMNLQAGSLSGTGTMTGAVINSGGLVQPGSSIVPGTLTLANYTQSAYGRLDLKIGGLLAGSQYDVLKVSGQGTFGGSLSVRLINGFTPGLGNTFNLLTCSFGCSGLNSGTLFGGGVSLPSLASGLAWLSGLTDGGHDFSLTVVAAAASAPEPGMLLLVGSGLLGLLVWRWLRQVQTSDK